MTSVLFSWRPPAAIERAVNAWYDAARSGRAVWVFLGLFVAIWTAFQIVSYASIGLHFDLLEAFAWSRNLTAGYKHPPLTAFVVRAWFSVFPVADWAFHLLAMVNAAVALFAVDLIARRHLDGDKRLLVLLLLLLTPFYQFHGQRFNANAILLSTWPIATYCFLRSFESRTLVWSAAAGATAALAMLGKYYSVFLVCGLVVAALVDPRRLDYLRSPAPWVSVLAGLAVLAPHLYRLFTFGAEPFFYAYFVHGGVPMMALLWKLLPYTLGAAGYVAIPILAYLLAVRPDRRTLAAVLWPCDPDRRMLVVLMAAPLLLPILFSPILGIRLTPLWTMSAWFLLPIVLLAPPEAVVSRTSAVNIALVVLGISLVVLVAAPAIAWLRFVDHGAGYDRAHLSGVSLELTREWRRAMQRPFTIVTGDPFLAQAATFYSPDHPQLWDIGTPRWTPWITAERRMREGWAAVCAVADKSCVAGVERAAGTAAGVVRVEYEHAATFLGMRGPPVRFAFILVPPAK
jgi:4-amino-4-deoxy-L-arabinose transferase-like glycosyltransferase